MEIIRARILESDEPVSKAAAYLEDNVVVIVTKNGRYYGLIDHRSLAEGAFRSAYADAMKCENVMQRPPVLKSDAGVLERVDAFLGGHFKALPVVDDKENPLGVTTRVELLDELKKNNLVPRQNVDELMNAPVYTIGQDETIAKAKKLMKENGTSRVVAVGSDGYPKGVLSAFDIASTSVKAKWASGRKDRKAERQPAIGEEIRISQLLRPDMTSVPCGTSLDAAIDKMVNNGVSNVIVMSGRKAVGVLSAVDIFKRLKEEAEQPETTAISGLSEDDMGLYPHIQEKLEHVVGKFRDTFDIRSVSVHVKEQKSTYVVKVHLEMDGDRVSLSQERKSLRETIDQLAMELNGILRKRKEIRKPKTRATHVRGRGKK